MLAVAGAASLAVPIVAICVLVIAGLLGIARWEIRRSTEVTVRRDEEDVDWRHLIPDRYRLPR